MSKLCPVRAAYRSGGGTISWLCHVFTVSSLVTACDPGTRGGALSRLHANAVRTHLQDEMRALQRINSVTFLAGYLGFLATFLLDTIYQLLHKAGVKATSDAVKAVLRALSPHYNLARCA